MININWRGLSRRVSNGASLSGIERLRQAGNVQDRLITNKAGRAVFRGCYNGRDVKVYEAFSADHAHFIATLSSKLPDVFPAILEVRGSWIIAEWVEGVPLLERDFEKQIDTLRRIHSVPTNECPSPGFCYWDDLILPRFVRVAELAGQMVLADQVASSIASECAHSVVMHPDLTPANMLKTMDGRILSLDNELVCTGTLPLLDLCNALNPLQPERRNRLARLWFSNETIRENDIHRTALAWGARVIGSAFIAGQLSKAVSTFEAIEKSPETLLPFDYNQLRRHAV